MTQAQIIKIDGQEWIIGLVWRSFAEHPTPHEYREDAQTLGADWIVLRETLGVTQTGFCPAVAGYKPKRIYSLAVAMAEEYKQPWRGIFKINDQLWWYIAIRDGQAILPDGDIAGDYAHVLAARERHDSYSDWQTHDGTMDDLLPLLEFYKKNNKISHLKSIKSAPLWRLIWPVFLIIILVIVGFLIYQHHENSLRLKEQRRVQAMRLAQHLNLSPLVTTPAPDEWLFACSKIINSLHISENGWIALNTNCTNNQITVIWGRLANATVAIRPPGTLFEDGNKVIQVYHLGYLPHGSTRLQSYTIADDMLYAILQPINVQAKISSPMRNPNKFYVIQHVSFTVPIAPFEMQFNKVPGLRITSLSWVQSGWELSGEIYAK